MRKRFIARGYPRIVMLLILTASGIVAFAVSALALGFGLNDMSLRYPVAAVAGYIAFLLLVRVWIALHRIGRSVDFGIPDLSVPASPSDPDAGFGGGQSGGAGATGNWDPLPSDLGVSDIGADVDEGWPVALALALALACLLGSALAMLYVVNAAPALLAEVALDAALVAGLYRKLRREDARHWLGSAVRHTWLPAVIVAVCLALTGAALQWAIPESQSIGDVVRALRD
jgi:hypothetical protein